MDFPLCIKGIRCIANEIWATFERQLSMMQERANQVIGDTVIERFLVPNADNVPTSTTIQHAGKGTFDCHILYWSRS